MNAMQTLVEYLNEKKPSRQMIIDAAAIVVENRFDFRSSESMQLELAQKSANGQAVPLALTSLAEKPEFLERAALAALSRTWEQPTGRVLILDAFDSTEGALNAKALVASAAIIVFGLWVWESEGGTFFRETTVKDPGGAFRYEKVERTPFPLDPVALLHEYLSPHDQPTQNDKAPLNLTETQIKQAQTALVDAGHPVRVDGLEGPQTAAAVEKYQRDHQLSTTGKLDRETLTRLGVLVNRS
jgi:hypothetical protein